MRKLLAVLGLVAFVGTGVAMAGKCDSCHKGDKALDKLTKAKGIDSCEKLLDALRKGPKAGLHKKFTDDDVKAECKVLNLK